jgi:hypothetical protein
MRPTRGSSSISSAKASATLKRIGRDVEQVDDRFGLRRDSAFGSKRTVQPLRTLDALHQVGHQPGEPLVGTDQHVGTSRSASSARCGEHLRNILERLALDQSREQQIALFPQRELLVEIDVVACRAAGGGSLSSTNVDSDQEELGGDVEVERLHLLELGEVRGRPCV